MGNYTIFLKFENPWKGRQARNFTTNVSKILDLESSTEQMFFRKLSLGAPVNLFIIKHPYSPNREHAKYFKPTNFLFRFF